MTDDDAARLRALATASLSTVKGRFDLAMEGDAILALLDALDEARRERDEARADQRRYCFLRAESNMMAPLCAVVWKRNGDRESSDWVNTINGLDLDRMVDAAIDALDGAKEPT